MRLRRYIFFSALISYLYESADRVWGLVRDRSVQDQELKIDY